MLSQIYLYENKYSSQNKHTPQRWKLQMCVAIENNYVTDRDDRQ